MILNVFDNIGDKLTEISNECYDFMMNNFDEPFLWIIITVVLLVITYSAISNMANK